MWLLIILLVISTLFLTAWLWANYYSISFLNGFASLALLLSGIILLGYGVGKLAELLFY